MQELANEIMKAVASAMKDYTPLHLLVNALQ
jgi:hypothetical protein